MRQLGRQAIRDISTGAAVLGTGGGGDPRIGRLMAEQAIRDHGPVRLLDPDQLPDDALIVPCAMMGAPTVMVEKPPRGDETLEAIRALERYLGAEAFATMSLEAGGINATVPLAVAATLNLPIVDADAMGRAFPEILQTTLTLGGISATPMAIADEKGNMLFLETIDNAWTERFSRSISVDMGGSAMIALYSHTGSELREHTIRGSLSRAEAIGRILRELRSSSERPVEALAAHFGGIPFFSGKLVDVFRRTTGGFARGTAVVEGLGESELHIEFQNEFLVARDRDGSVLATVPDSICLLDRETGCPVTTESLSYGQRVDALAFPAAEPWRTDEGLALGGPEFFGFEIDYVPVEELTGAP